MWRITLPIVCMTSAALLLVAGASGDLPSWRQDWPAATAQLPDAVSHQLKNAAAQLPIAVSELKKDVAHLDTPAPAQARPADQTQDVQKRQADDLRAQIARETRDLAALRATTEQARQDLVSVRQRRDQEQAALTQIAARTQAAAPPPATPAPTTAAVAADPIVTRLSQARDDLSSGRRAQARRQLRSLRSQIARLPEKSPDRGDKVRGQVEYAIALLDRGDRGGALQTLDHALAEANGPPLNQPDSSR